jgi:hypothetical protein
MNIDKFDDEEGEIIEFIPDMSSKLKQTSEQGVNSTPIRTKNVKIGTAKNVSVKVFVCSYLTCPHSLK